MAALKVMQANDPSNYAAIFGGEAGGSMKPFDTNILAGVTKAIYTTAEQAAQNLEAFNAEAEKRSAAGERPSYQKPLPPTPSMKEPPC